MQNEREKDKTRKNETKREITGQNNKERDKTRKNRRQNKKEQGKMEKE